MKILAVSNDPDSMEKLINDYFYSVGYELVLVKRTNDSGKVVDLKYIIENKRLSQDVVINTNLDYVVKFKKGKYYFYRYEKKDKKGK